MTQSVIIVAGGKGLRMGSELPKQFIPLAGKPLLMHTIEVFYRYNPLICIVLVLPQLHKDYWQQLCAAYKFNIAHQIAIGGNTRFHSVKNGLALVTSDYVGVHDAARPCVSATLIDACYNMAQQLDAVVPFTDATDSLREVVATTEGRIIKSSIVDRTKIKSIQTPQVFSTIVLKRAYEASYSDSFTDDASVVEAMGIEVQLIAGENNNIKVTSPIDLKIAELLLTSTY